MICPICEKPVEPGRGLPWRASHAILLKNKDQVVPADAVVHATCVGFCTRGPAGEIADLLVDVLRAFFSNDPKYPR